jgi:hypothetical protein
MASRGEQRFVNVLDSQAEKVGAKTWRQGDVIKRQDSQVVKEIGGPCRDRTYGPLIKSGKQAILKRLAIAMVSPF